MKILRHLKHLEADIALLQETHLSSSDFQRMKKPWVGEDVGSKAIGRKAGVLILLHKNLQYDLISFPTSSGRGGTLKWLCIKMRIDLLVLN